MMKLLLPFLTLSLLLVSYSISAQPSEEPSGRVRLFLDCDDCDFSYFRRNINFVDFVRDPQEADLHVLVTRQFTASLGRNYRMNFIGKEGFENLNYQLEFDSPQSDTDALRRDRLIRQLEMGLMPYIARTPESQGLSIDYNGEEVKEEYATPREDNWNYWVFRLGMGIGFEAQEQQNEVNFDSYVRADRITENWKFRSSLAFDYREENFEDDGEEIQSIRRFNEWESELVMSITPRWSAGVFNQVYSSTFRNVKLSAEVAPAVEYNIFPWDQSDRKVLALAYFAGVRYYDYITSTLYGYQEETRWFHALRLFLALRQPWGEVESRLEGFHYLHDLSLNRITFDTELSVRITKGLSVYSDIRIESIHDQLYLPKGDASLEEILLRQRQLATTYEIRTEFGFRYTFGSIFNNVVNPRL